MTLIRPSSSKVNALIGGQPGQLTAMVRGISLQVQKEEEDDEALERERVRELESVFLGPKKNCHNNRLQLVLSYLVGFNQWLFCWVESKVNALIGGQLGQSTAMVRGISLQVQKEEEDDDALERERVRELERLFCWVESKVNALIGGQLGQSTAMVRGISLHVQKEEEDVDALERERGRVLERLRTHACMEVYTIDTHRQLSSMHPIYKLLHPRMRYLPSSSKVNALIGGQPGQSTAMVRGISLQVQKEEEDDEALERERVRELESVFLGPKKNCHNISWQLVLSYLVGFNQRLFSWVESKVKALIGGQLGQSTAMVRGISLQVQKEEEDDDALERERGRELESWVQSKVNALIGGQLGQSTAMVRGISLQVQKEEEDDDALERERVRELERLRTHACMEVYTIDTHRQLSSMHVIYKLLHPHMRY
ncbi:hypothetical protein FRX31_008312, partial [Thalictrum thalictroides]